MCCDGPDTPDPDPRVGQAQDKLADLAIRQQDYYEKNFAPKVLSQLDQSIRISEDQARKQAELQDFQTGLMRKYDDRYWGTQVPLEDELISEARKFNTVAERERMAGEAGADVEQTGAMARENLGLQLRGMGINPGSAAAISAMADMESQTQLAKAGAFNKTRTAARELGWTKLGEAAALGRGLPSFGSTSASLASGAGGAALGAGQAGLGAVGQASGISNGAYGAAGGLWSQAGNLGVANYNAQVNAANVKASNDPFNTILGAAAGVGTKFALNKWGP